MTSVKCWCGNVPSQDFSSDYYVCDQCQTLVLKDFPDVDLTDVKDQGELYGEAYYQVRLPKTYGFPTLDERARQDLPNRIVHWLSVLLKYKLPPGRALDIGAAHGGFVKVLGDAGFDAQGLELSPWLCDYAHNTFGVSMLAGPIEKQGLQPASYTAISMMDVVEHLQDPIGTLSVVANLLDPQGLLLVQTPEYRPDFSYADFVRTGDRFVEHLKPEEHLFLFNRQSISSLLDRVGLTHIVFQPAAFDFYDMFVLASKEPLEAYTEGEIESSLTADPGRRVILALLDAYRGRQSLQEQLQDLGADNAQRLAVIGEQGQQLAEAHASAHRLAEEVQRLGAIAKTQASEILSIEDALEQEISNRQRLQGQLENIIRSKAEIESALEEARMRTPVLAGKTQALESQKSALEQLVHGVNGSRIYRAIRRLGLWRWFQDGLTQYITLASIDHVRNPATESAGGIQAGALSSEAYRHSIDVFNQEQANSELLDAIREHNHTMLGLLGEWHSLGNAILLDAGASPHGYALEHALDLGVSLYVGIGLDIAEPVRVHTDLGHTGILLNMDVTDLRFPDETFDCAISVSMFEHVVDIHGALKELYRVLRPGGTLFLDFEPIWTSAHGHHLHHFGEWTKIVPPWGHLLWDRDRMEAELKPDWPKDASLTIQETLEWVYESDSINRVHASDYRRMFSESALQVAWLQEIPDETTSEASLQNAAERLRIEAADLRIRGFKAVLRKS